MAITRKIIPSLNLTAYTGPTGELDRVFHGSQGSSSPGNTEKFLLSQGQIRQGMHLFEDYSGFQGFSLEGRTEIWDPQWCGWAGFSDDAKSINFEIENFDRPKCTDEPAFYEKSLDRLLVSIWLGQDITSQITHPTAEPVFLRLREVYGRNDWAIYQTVYFSMGKLDCSVIIKDPTHTYSTIPYQIVFTDLKYLLMGAQTPVHFNHLDGHFKVTGGDTFTLKPGNAQDYFWVHLNGRDAIGKLPEDQLFIDLAGMLYPYVNRFSINPISDPAKFLKGRPEWQCKNPDLLIDKKANSTYHLRIQQLADRYKKDENFKRFLSCL